MIFPEKIYNLLISNPRFDFSFSLLQVKKRVENRVDQKFPKNFPSENSKTPRWNQQNYLHACLRQCSWIISGPCFSDCFASWRIFQSLLVIIVHRIQEYSTKSFSNRCLFPLDLKSTRSLRLRQWRSLWGRFQASLRKPQPPRPNRQQLRFLNHFWLTLWNVWQQSYLRSFK